jgi:hypothetical protein
MKAYTRRTAQWIESGKHVGQSNSLFLLLRFGVSPPLVDGDGREGDGAVPSDRPDTNQYKTARWRVRVSNNLPSMVSVRAGKTWLAGQGAHVSSLSLAWDEVVCSSASLPRCQTVETALKGAGALPFALRTQ